MSKYLIIKSEVPFSVSISDLNVHLRGKGATETVLEESALVSADLRDKVARRWVTLSNQGVAARRMWPTASPVFLPPLPPPASDPSAVDPLAPAVPAPAAAVDPELVRILRGIDEKLGALLTRPSPPPAEVVAAHVRSLAAMASIPDGLPGAPHPQFIPSTILPDDGGKASTIKVRQEDSKIAVDDSVSALKNLRRRT